ncbi:MAG: glycosyltransferase [Candidatus Dormibacteraeota bacterium]|nr:glycosyltransferase [Candidatus Dormibacteraeota bacterium]
MHLIHLRSWLWFLVPFLVFTLGYYLISLRVNLTSHNFDITTHRTLVAAWTPASYPTVDVWLPVCGEDLELLSNTWKHVARMRRRYPGSVTVYVLDDGDDAEAAELARSLGFTYIVRPDRGRLKKAGNLRNAYRNSEGEYIVILDADFTPRDDFLLQTLPYMHHDPSLGILQTPQYFRQSAAQTLMERGAGAVQELFYRVVQVSRDLLDGAICVGSCGVYRRTALDSIGGTTQIEHSEDVHTGFDLRCAGWRLRYIPVPLATGVCPQEPDAFFTQQYRWCAGSMSLLASAKFWRAKMPFSTRLCYLSGFCYYIHTAIATFLVPLIPIVLLAFLPEQIQLRNYLWIAPSAAYTLVIFPMWNRARYGPSAMMAKSLYGWSHWFAIIDILRKRRLGWHTTGATGRRPTRRIWVSMATWGGVTIAAWTGLCVYRMLTMTPVNFVFLMIMALAYGTTCVALPFVARAQGRRRLAT